MGLVREIKAAASGHGHGCGCAACRETYFRSGAVDRVLLWRVAAGALLFVAAWATRAGLPAVSLLLAIASVLCAGYDRMICSVARSIRDRTVDADLLMTVVVIAAAAVGRAVEGAAEMLLCQTAVLVSGALAVRTDGQIAALTEDGVTADCDAEDKSRMEEFVTHFSRSYTPIILGIAVVLAVLFPTVLHTSVREGISRVLILMLIACPCALLLSVPLTFTAGLGGMAAQGAAVSGTGAEDRLSRAETVIFEQRAALEGEGLRVLSVRSDRMEADVLLRIAAHACAYSDGVYAEAIKASYRDTIYIELIQSFMQEPGRGITVEVDGVNIILGIEEFVREHDVDPGLDLVKEPAVYLAIDGKYAGRILLGPVARPAAASAVTALSWDRPRRAILVSEAPVSGTERFARLVGISQYYGDCPAEKRPEVVENMRERMLRRDTLIYAGDPESDKACFDLADVGYAARSGATVTSADGDPAVLVRAIAAAGHTKRVALQSVIFLLAVKVLVLALDMLGFCPLWLAVLADSGVAALVALAAVRALYPKIPQLPEE